MARHNSNRTIVILGAGSDMALPLIRLLFQQWQSSRFYLLARNITTLQKLAEEGRKWGHTVDLIHYDLEAPTSLPISGVDTCITYVGWLPVNNGEPERAMLLNYTGVEHFLERLIADNKATLQHIILTGSIAGVRVRPANQAYGKAKAALHQYARHLQQKWKGKIATTLVIPGYVETKMLVGMKTPPLLTTTPQALAEKYGGWLESKPTVAYSQPVWKGIALGLKLLPQFVIDRMKK